MASKRTGPKKALTPAHKAAMAEGRSDGKIVDRYLVALEQTKPRRGRQRSTATIDKRLVAIKAELDAGAKPLKIVHLVQERFDLEAERRALTAKDGNQIPALEKDFVKVGKRYAQRKGLTYAAWREVGVSADVLRRAGIARGGA